MPDVQIVATLPDGILLGVDDDGVVYRGAPTLLAPEDMRVETVVGDDGESYTRTTYLPDGSVYGHGEATRDAFVETVLGNVTANFPPGDVAAEVERRWQAEVDLAGHVGSIPAAVTTWTQEG